MTLPEGLDVPSYIYETSLKSIGIDTQDEEDGEETKSKVYAHAAQKVSRMLPEVRRHIQSSRLAAATKKRGEDEEGWVVALPRSKDRSQRSAMIIVLRNLSGVETSIAADPVAKVSRLKDCYGAQRGIPPTILRFIYGGKQMADDKEIRDVSKVYRECLDRRCDTDQPQYGIDNGATIHVVLACRGS